VEQRLAVLTAIPREPPRRSRRRVRQPAHLRRQRVLPDSVRRPRRAHGDDAMS